MVKELLLSLGYSDGEINIILNNDRLSKNTTDTLFIYKE